MPRIKPLRDRVLVKLEGADTVSRGGIIIPDIAQERAIQQGEVMAVGKDTGIVCIGDRVILTKFAGHEIELNKVKHTIVKEEDILGVV